LDKRKPKEVKSTLDKLKKGAAALDIAYSGALQRIEGQLYNDCKLAKDVLTWITLAKRPLTTAELCCALAVEPGETELDPENKLDVDDIVSVCAGLIVVDQESAIIRLVHYTTQEYFERINSRLNPDGQLEIAQTCLTYLSFSVFESGSCTTDEEFKERLRQHELLNYAAKYCGEHARPVEAKVAYSICMLVSQSGIFSCAAQALFVTSSKYIWSGAKIPAVTGLHWIARFGLCDAAKEFLRRGEDETCAVNATDSNGESSLMYAVEHGHCAMAEMLLDKGADINAQGGTFGNALQAASFRGHEAVVRLLLNKGADVNAQGGTYGNALHAASFRDHKAVVRLLLNKGADINAQGGTFGNALQAASIQGHKAVVRLLLDKGADVNAQGRYYGNTLHAAVYAGKNEVLERLIEEDSIRQFHDPYDRTLLWWAAAGGQTTTAQVLISRYNYDSQTADKFGRTPLWIAMKKGHRAVSELLSEECGPTDPGQTVSPDHSDDSGSIRCDVCTSSIRATDFHYHCRHCSNGDWDVCEDCRVRGAFCAEETHILVKRTRIDQTWVEMAY